jgi:hypothetical protein
LQAGSVTPVPRAAGELAMQGPQPVLSSSSQAIVPWPCMHRSGFSPSWAQ